MCSVYTYTPTHTSPASLFFRKRLSQAIEDVVVSKRRAQYEEALSKEVLDYDTWFDYIRLEEAQVRPPTGCVMRRRRLGCC